MGRISKRKNPLLFNILNNGKEYKARKEFKFITSVYLEVVRTHKGKLKDIINVNYASKKFEEKAIRIVEDALPDVNALNRFMIMGRSISDGDYYIKRNGKEFLLHFDKGNFYGFVGLHGTWGVIFISNDDNSIDLFTRDGVDMNDDIKHGIFLYIAKVFCILWYKQNAGLEVKIIPGQSKKKLFNCAYKNESPVPIDILDANWYTTIIRVKPVIRRAHKRKQWYGKGRSKYKIIDVPEMLINGYTRRAKIANSER